MVAFCVVNRTTVCIQNNTSLLVLDPPVVHNSYVGMFLGICFSCASCCVLLRVATTECRQAMKHANARYTVPNIITCVGQVSKSGWI
jgi:hypothetical protein